MMLCASYFSFSQSRLIFVAVKGINPWNLLNLFAALLCMLNIAVCSILFILNKTLNREKKDEDSSWEQLLTDSSRIWSSQEEGEQEDNIHKKFLDNLLSCMPLIANFTTRGFHENCLINGKSASVCREIVFLKTSRFVWVCAVIWLFNFWWWYS